MWHEARKQEKLIRGMIVDYRRRAERRKDFYEKIKAEPTQFLQIHGRPCKIHLDPTVAAAGEGPAIMMQWQSDPNIMIDRFDVRAHLDYIPDQKFPDTPTEDLSHEERHCNYERYRILAQNAFLGINEDKFLHQLAVEETYGITLEEKEMQKEKYNEKKGMGAAIGYNYNDPGAQPSTSNGPENKTIEQKESDEDSDIDILDVDLSIDVNKMEAAQAHNLNAVGPLFGMAGRDLFSFLTGDADDAEHQKQLIREEKEKAMFSGRKSRRERRAHRDKKLAARVMSPPSYAAPSHRRRSPTRSPTRSPSPETTAAPIQFITSFGADDDEPKPTMPPEKPLYSEKVKQNLRKSDLYSEVAKRNRSSAQDKYSRPIGPRGPRSRSKSRSSISSKSLSRSRSRSSHRKSRSRSYSKSRSHSRSRSRSRSQNRRMRRSQSPTNNSAKRNKSRSMSYESNERNDPAKSAVPRYYGRRQEDKSSSELSLDSGSSDSEQDKDKPSVCDKTNTNQNQLRSSGSSTKGPSRDGLTLKEKLKKKMQAQLSRQLRLDKRVEAERAARESRQQARRDEEMRMLAIKLRRKQREMRHKYRRSSDESDRSRSRSSSRDTGPPGDDKRSRSRSQSPKDRRIPVWETKEDVSYRSKPFEGNTYERRRYHEERVFTDNRRSRSRSPKKHIPVWENPAQSYSRRYQDDARQDYSRFDSSRNYPRHESRFEQNQYESRWDSKRRPYGHRGGYRGSRQSHGDGPSNWSRDSPDNRHSESRNKVKLVDY